MKNLILALSLVPALAFATAPDFSAISRALNSGDVATLSTYFDSNIEVTVLDTDGVYSKQQAQQILKNFFADHQPQSYKLVHQGTNNRNLHYCIGDLVANGQTFRVNYFLKEVNGKFVIQEFGIEKE